MKLILVILISLFCNLTNASEDLNFSDDDKKLHLITSYALTYTLTDIYRRVGYSKFESLLYGSMTTMLIGLAKELTDKQYSGSDMQANAVGLFVGIGVVFTFDSLVGI